MYNHMNTMSSIVLDSSVGFQLGTFLIPTVVVLSLIGMILSVAISLSTYEKLKSVKEKKTVAYSIFAGFFGTIVLVASLFSFYVSTTVTPEVAADFSPRGVSDLMEEKYGEDNVIVAQEEEYDPDSELYHGVYLIFDSEELEAHYYNVRVNLEGEVTLEKTESQQSSNEEWREQLVD